MKALVIGCIDGFILMLHWSVCGKLEYWSEFWKLIWAEVYVIWECVRPLAIATFTYDAYIVVILYILGYINFKVIIQNR